MNTLGVTLDYIGTDVIPLKKEHSPQGADLVAANEALKPQEDQDATLQSAAEKSKSTQKM